MDYQVSARKYRPMTFASVVGQEALTTTLKNAVTSGKLAHAFLFCGPRGVGKTTCARIFAKTINCQNITADGEACGECESCKAFAEGRSLNVIELDGASNNGVDSIKALMEQTRIPPQIGKYKVFIIDEVHMLSTTAFNAFLKTLEEPPTYVIFILATTEKHKILPTIISRCQIYDFDRMNIPNTVNHLKMVAEREGYTYEEEALQVIAEKADGGMRDALSIFDQAASFCQGNITLEKVINDLHLLDTENYFDLTDYALENKCAEAMVKINTMISNGMDGNNIVLGMMNHVRNLMMVRDPQTAHLLDVSERYKERYKEQAQKCKPAFLYRALQLLNRCDLNYRQSSNKRLLVELTFIEVAQITQPADDPSAAPRGGKRLKSLFKRIIKSVSEPVKQVTGTATSAPQDQQTSSASIQMSTSAPNATANVADTTTTVNVTTQQKPQRLKISGLGMTLSSLMKAEEKKNAEEVIEVSNKDEEKPFDEGMLNLEWLSMCNRMQERYAGLSASMRQLRLSITDFPAVECAVPNSILLDQMSALRKRMEVTLAQRLHHGGLKLNLRLAKQEEIVLPMTKRELFEKILSQYKEIANMVKELKLTLG